MDRAACQHRREAKAERRAKRNANGKRKFSPHRGIQLAARLTVSGRNLENLMAMAGAQHTTLRIFKIRKPKLVHVSPTLRLDDHRLARAGRSAQL